MSVIQKLRLKLVLTNMAIVTLILGTMGAAMLGITGRSLRQESVDYLRKAAQEDFSMTWPGQRPRDGINLPNFTVLVGLDGTVGLLSNNFGAVEDVEQLKNVVQSCMRQPEALGELKSYNLRYLRSETLLGWRVTFVDTSQEQSTLRALATDLLFLGLLAFGVFLVLSFFLAKWATGPVEESWRRQRQFVSDASHELKTPLTVILSNVDMLENGGLRDPREARWVDNIKAASGQMTELVEALLTLARHDNQGKAALLRERVNLSELAQEQALLFEPVLFEAEKELQDHIEEGIFVTGDPSKLKRLMVILLDNARKYAAPQTVVTFRLTAEANKKIRLSVNTKGQPIPKEQLSKLFERFYRAEQSRTSEGYGLGLSIAQQIAQEHGGKLWAESSETEGNTFAFTMNREK